MRLVYPTMFRLGPENFGIFVLEACPKNMVDVRELFWIRKMGNTMNVRGVYRTDRKWTLLLNGNVGLPKYTKAQHTTLPTCEVQRTATCATKNSHVGQKTLPGTPKKPMLPKGRTQNANTNRAVTAQPRSTAGTSHDTHTRFPPPKPPPCTRTCACSYLFACSYFLRVLISETLGVFPAPFVCRNMAELNVDDPSFWLNDEAAKEKAARYEQTKRLFNRGKGARNAVGKVERYQYGPNPVVHFVCRHAEIGTPGPVGSNRVKIRNSWYASRGWPMQKLGPGHMREASGKSLKTPGMPAEANSC